MHGLRFGLYLKPHSFEAGQVPTTLALLDSLFSRALLQAASSLESTKRTDSTHKSVEETLRIVKKIQSDLGIADDGSVVKSRYSPKDNYPAWTKQHHSLTSKYCTLPVYEKYAGVKTPSGFSFDQVCGYQKIRCKRHDWRACSPTVLLSWAWFYVRAVF